MLRWEVAELAATRSDGILEGPQSRRNHGCGRPGRRLGALRPTRSELGSHRACGHTGWTGAPGTKEELFDWRLTVRLRKHRRFAGGVDGGWAWQRTERLELRWLQLFARAWCRARPAPAGPVPRMRPLGGVRPKSLDRSALGWPAAHPFRSKVALPLRRTPRSPRDLVGAGRAPCRGSFDLPVPLGPRGFRAGGLSLALSACGLALRDVAGDD